MKKKENKKLKRKTKEQLKDFISGVPKEVENLLNACFEDFTESEAQEFMENVRRKIGKK